MPNDVLEDVKLMLQTMGVDSQVVSGNETEQSLLLLTASEVTKLHSLGFEPKAFHQRKKAAGQRTKPPHVRIVSVKRTGRQDATYCFNEPLKHRGIFNGIVAGNCCEITEYTSSSESAVCNLASIGLPTYIKHNKNRKNGKNGTSDKTGMEEPSFDFNLLHEKVKVVTKNLDKVVDETHYPVAATRYSNLRHRPIGVGVSGLADTFSLMRLPFDSPEARQLNKDIFETIYHAAVEASCEQAAELGPYETYEGSEFSKGKFQWNLWEDESSTPVVHSGLWDWDALREKMLKHGMRNSLLTAPMPTASTSQIIGFNEAFEPYNSNIYKRQTLSGEFQVINKYLLSDLCERGIWSEELKERIIENRGSVQGIAEIPLDIQKLYKTTWETSQKVIIDMAADRGPYVDQSQSMNIFMAEPSFKKLSAMHFYGWERGLKTGMYYLKSKAAAAPLQFSVGSKRERSVPVEENSAKRPSLGAGPAAGTSNQAVEEPAAMCSMEEGCMSCSG